MQRGSRCKYTSNDRLWAESGSGPLERGRVRLARPHMVGAPDQKRAVCNAVNTEHAYVMSDALLDLARHVATTEADYLSHCTGDDEYVDEAAHFRAAFTNLAELLGPADLAGLERRLADALVGSVCHCGPRPHTQGFPQCATARRAARAAIAEITSNSHV